MVFDITIGTFDVSRIDQLGLTLFSKEDRILFKLSAQDHANLLKLLDKHGNRRNHHNGRIFLDTLARTIVLRLCIGTDHLVITNLVFGIKGRFDELAKDSTKIGVSSVVNRR